MSSRTRLAGMKEFLEQVPMWIKVLTVITGAALVLNKHIAVPAHVNANTQTLVSLSEHVEDIDRALIRIDGQYSRIICLLTLTEEVRAQAASNPMVLERECR